MGIEVHRPEQDTRGDSGKKKRPRELGAAADSLAAPAFEFQHVIGKANATEADCHEQRDPNVEVANIGQENRRENRGGQNQQSTHSRGTGFFLMGLRNLVANGLADMRGAKPFDQDRPEREREREGGEPRHDGAKGFVAQNAETDVMSVEGIEEEVEHQVRPTKVAEVMTGWSRRPKP